MLRLIDGDWPLPGRLEVRGMPVLPPAGRVALSEIAGAVGAVV